MAGVGLAITVSPGEPRDDRTASPAPPLEVAQGENLELRCRLAALQAE